MIYKGIKVLCGDPTPLWKTVENYGIVASAYLFLKKASSLCCHAIDLRQEKAMCIEQVEVAQSNLTMVHADADVL